MANTIAIGYGLYYISIAPTAEETFWNRFVGLLPIIEALLFASAGFIFGKEVHREQAEKAEERANRENKRAENAVARGKVLASDISSFAIACGPQGDQRLTKLAEKANNYFPE